MTGSPTLDALLDALARDPHDEHSLCAFLDYLVAEARPEHALNALRLLAQESADACTVRKKLNHANRTLKFFTKREDAIDDGLPRLIREAKETDRLRSAVAHGIGERVES